MTRKREYLDDLRRSTGTVLRHPDRTRHSRSAKSLSWSPNTRSTLISASFGFEVVPALSAGIQDRRVGRVVAFRQ